MKTWMRLDSKAPAGKSLSRGTLVRRRQQVECGSGLSRILDLAKRLGGCFVFLAGLVVVPAATNFFPALTVGDRTYTNVTLASFTAMDAILRFEGGGARVALSNLPPDLQRQLNYDPVRAEVERAERRKQRTAFLERQATVAAQTAATGAPRTLRVTRVDASAGTPRCITDAGEIWIQNLPPATAKYLTDRRNLEQQIRTLNTRIEANTRAWTLEESMAPTLPPGPEWYVERLRAQRWRANRLKAVIAEQAATRQQLSQNLQELIGNGESLSRIIAARTSRTYLGLEIWKSLGIAPPPAAGKSGDTGTAAAGSEGADSPDASAGSPQN